VDAKARGLMQASRERGVQAIWTDEVYRPDLRPTGEIDEQVDVEALFVQRPDVPDVRARTVEFLGGGR
jgi:hypothetical protein